MSQIEQNRNVFNETSEHVLDQFIEETGDSSSQYLKIQDGQSVKLIFDMMHDNTGFKDRTFEKDGKPTIVKRFSFQVRNEKLGRDQIWEVSTRWAQRALKYMKSAKTFTLVVSRTGSTMNNTDYMFVPA